jgi:hypothetical protein
VAFLILAADFLVGAIFGMSITALCVGASRTFSTEKSHDAKTVEKPVDAPWRCAVYQRFYGDDLDDTRF